jgi:hypothetical protein
LFLELTKLNCTKCIVIDEDVHRALKDFSENSGLRLSLIATNAIHEYLKNVKVDNDE